MKGTIYVYLGIKYLIKIHFRYQSLLFNVYNSTHYFVLYILTFASCDPKSVTRTNHRLDPSSSIRYIAKLSLSFTAAQSSNLRCDKLLSSNSYDSGFNPMTLFKYTSRAYTSPTFLPSISLNARNSSAGLVCIFIKVKLRFIHPCRLIAFYVSNFILPKQIFVVGSIFKCTYS